TCVTPMHVLHWKGASTAKEADCMRDLERFGARARHLGLGRIAPCVTSCVLCMWMCFEASGGSFINRDFRGDNRPRETRVHERIRAREVRLIDEDGQVVGVMPPAQALALARERDVDLVEVSPMAVPPVCRLMDWGRYKYEQSKKENEARKHQKVTELKEIRM